jgi:hypothetical protein
MSDKLVAETSTGQHAALTTDIHAPGSIRTRNPSKRAAADPRLRLRGHWGPVYKTLQNSNNFVLNVLCSFDGIRLFSWPIALPIVQMLNN